jgi:hypothetical protein
MWRTELKKRPQRRVSSAIRITEMCCASITLAMHSCLQRSRSLKI